MRCFFVKHSASISKFEWFEHLWMKSFGFSMLVSCICFSAGAFKGRKFIIFIVFSWSFSVLNFSFWYCPHISQPYIKFELNNEIRVFNENFGVKCLIFARSPYPWLSFFFILLKHKSQSKCSFIVRPRYLTYIACRIYWPLILKFRCFAMFLLDLGLNSKILNGFNCILKIFCLLWAM